MVSHNDNLHTSSTSFDIQTKRFIVLENVIRNFFVHFHSSQIQFFVYQSIDSIDFMSQSQNTNNVCIFGIEWSITQYDILFSSQSDEYLALSQKFKWETENEIRRHTKKESQWMSALIVLTRLVKQMNN